MNWKKRGFEFLSIFIAVISAFALNNWNDNRRDANSENKILVEISNGLGKDLEDIEANIIGHEEGIAACKYFRRAIAGIEVPKDSFIMHYFNLTRDFVTIQNSAGYESLKSKGLELLEDNSIRFKIISLYEYDYTAMRKFEEEYQEMQYFANYFDDLNEEIAPYFIANDQGTLVDVKLPLEIEESKRNILLLNLWKIETNRAFVLLFYKGVDAKINDVRSRVAKYLKR
jgi:hypothetical protein